MNTSLDDSEQIPTALAAGACCGRDVVTADPMRAVRGTSLTQDSNRAASYDAETAREYIAPVYADALAPEHLLGVMILNEDGSAPVLRTDDPDTIDALAARLRLFAQHLRTCTPYTPTSPEPHAVESDARTAGACPVGSLDERREQGGEA